VNLPQPAPLQTIPLFASPILCYGDANAVVSVVVNGGTYPYSYEWSNGDTDSIATNLDIGEVFITVTDANGCQVISNYGINQPPVIELTLQGSTVNCVG